MMLSSISWQQYALAATVITGFYYSFIIFRYYQGEITRLFGAGRKQRSPGAVFTSSAFQVMGEAKPDDTTRVSDSGELNFADPSSDDEDINTLVRATPGAPEHLREDTDELMADAEQLIDAFKHNDHKTEFLSLLNILIGAYEKTTGQPAATETLDRIIKS